MTAFASMFPYLILVGLLAGTESFERCYNNTQTFQCSCIDQKGYTPFWTVHSKNVHGKWDGTISVTGDKCNEEDAITFLRHKSISKGPSKRYTVTDMLTQGYIKNGDSLYKLHSTKTFWDKGRRICLSEGSHLAIPNSDVEVEFLENLLQGKEEVAFIGMHDILNEGEHVTVFGEPATIAYENFDSAAKLTNSRTVGLAGEDCLSVHKDGHIADVPCSHSYSFICEKELNRYPPLRDIDYNNGPYKGIESAPRPPKGIVERTVPSAGYAYHPGFGFYRFHSTPQTWESARHMCDKEDAHLVIINSVYEHNILIKYFEHHVLKGKEVIDDENRAHVGFHDMYEEGHHVTLYNETLEKAGFSEWFEEGQPDNKKGDKNSHGENCGAIYRNGGIDDVDCDKLLAYICEQELYEK